MYTIPQQEEALDEGLNQQLINIVDEERSDDLSDNNNPSPKCVLPLKY